MKLLEFKIWGGKVVYNHPMYIWARDADTAFFGIARRIESSVTAYQWTGNEIDTAKENTMNQGNYEQGTAWRQSRALLGIGESMKKYANLHNHYIRVDSWDKACLMRHMIDNLGCAIPFIEESLGFKVILDSDGEMIKEIDITCNGDVIGLPWKLDHEVMK